MSTGIYIQSASCISPQQTFVDGVLPTGSTKYPHGKMQAIEPDYKIHLNIPSARRMSRLIRMGVCAALSSSARAGVKVPDAIICGTGLGCMEDSEKFLSSLIDNNEHTLSPTSFIFSTHNTVAAQVALLMQCNNYNFTHTHRGLSFENALVDAKLFIGDHPGANVLVGAADEVTNTSYKILERLGATRKENDAGMVGQGSGSGFIPGEGSAFFILHGVKKEESLAKFTAVVTFSNPEHEDEIAQRVSDFISSYGISSDDLILAGMNGDPAGDKIYADVLQRHFSRNTTCSFKHLCGEYHTASAFAFWVAAMVLKEHRIPGYLLPELRGSENPRRVLIFNHYKGREFSLVLLERC